MPPPLMLLATTEGEVLVLLDRVDYIQQDPKHRDTCMVHLKTGKSFEVLGHIQGLMEKLRGK